MANLRGQPNLMNEPFFKKESLLKAHSWRPDRRALMKAVGSLAALVGLERVATAMSAGLSIHPDVTNQLDFTLMRHTQRSVASSWLNRQIGFQLAHEQFPVPELVELGVAAENAGFDLLAFSDHLQPWQENEGHAGLAWITMTAIGQRTRRIRMGRP